MTRAALLLLALALSGCATVSPNLTNRQVAEQARRAAVEDSVSRGLRSGTLAAKPPEKPTAAWVEPQESYNLRLTFTAPGDSTSTGGWRACSHYVVRRTWPSGRQDTVQALKPLSPTNAGLVPAIPAAPGERDTIFVPFDSTANWREGGIGYQIAAEDGARNRAERWSNAVQAIVSRFLPDTAYYFDGPRMPRDSTWWKWGAQDGTFARHVSWSLQPGDTVARARILHQELVQREHWQDIRRLYGYVVVRGLPDSSEAAP